MWNLSSRLFFYKIYSHVHINRRLIVSCRVLYKSKSVEPVKTNDSQISKVKVISGTQVKLAKESETLLYLRNLSARSKLLTVFLHRPIALVEWIESPLETKKKSLINLVATWVFCLVFFFVVISAYISFLCEQHEITKRWFYNLYSEDFIKLYEEEKLKQIMKRYEGRFCTDKALIQRCDQIMQKIIKFNKDYVNNEDFNMAWCTAIVDNGADLQLHLIGSSKFLILSKALVELCQNDHQLAYLISHSLAHFLLKHSREPLTNLKPYQLWTGFRFLFYFRLYFWFTPGEMLETFDSTWLKFLNSLDRKIAQFWLNLYQPLEMALNFCDKLEEESDRIAMQLLARSCYDIREVETLLAKGHEMLKQLDEPSDKSNQHRYLLQHSFSQHKLTSVHNNLDKFVQFRSICGCPDLK